MSNPIIIKRKKQLNLCPSCLAKGIDSCAPPKSDLITIEASVTFSDKDAKKKYEGLHVMSQPLSHVYWSNLQFNIKSVPPLLRKGLRDYEGATFSFKSEDPFNGDQVQAEAIDALLDTHCCFDIIHNKATKKSLLVTCVSIASRILDSENILNEDFYKAAHDGTSLMCFCWEQSLKELSIEMTLDSTDSKLLTISHIGKFSNFFPKDYQYQIILPKKQSFFDFFVGKNHFDFSTQDNKTFHSSVEIKYLMLKQIVSSLKLTIDNFGRYSSVSTASYIKVIKSIYQLLKIAKSNQTKHSK